MAVHTLASAGIGDRRRHAAAADLHEGAVPSPSTDSVRSHQETFPVGRFGVDTFGARGPVDASAARRLPHQRLRRVYDEDTGEVFDVLTSARGSWDQGIRFIVESWRTGAPEVRIEFSVPRILNGDNRIPASADDVRAAVQRAYRDVEDAGIPWTCPPSALSVVRLDIARDFQGVADGPRLLAALWDVPAVRMRTHGYKSRNGRGVQTLARESKRHTGKLYNRGAHYIDRALDTWGEKRRVLEELADADAGVVRFELMLRREQAAAERLGSVGDLDSARLADVARRHFYDRCHFGDVIAGPAWKIKAAANDLNLAGKQSAILTTIGQLAVDAWDISPGRHPKTVTAYRAEYRRLGLDPSDFGRPETTPVRFDFASGMVVPVVAPTAVATST